MFTLDRNAHQGADGQVDAEILVEASQVAVEDEELRELSDRSALERLQALENIRALVVVEAWSFGEVVVRLAGPRGCGVSRTAKRRDCHSFQGLSIDSTMPSPRTWT